MMRAGRLDRVLTVERLSGPPDAYGVEATWAPIATLRAELVRKGGEEFLRTRFLDGLTVADRIVLDGEALDIQDVREIGRRRGLEIYTVATGAP